MDYQIEPGPRWVKTRREIAQVEGILRVGPDGEEFFHAGYGLGFGGDFAKPNHRGYRRPAGADSPGDGRESKR